MRCAISAYNEQEDYMDYFRLLPSYLRAHAAYFIMTALCTSVFSIMTFLYGVPADGIVYALILCGCTGLICFIPSFRRFMRRHKQLSELTALDTIEAPALPEATYLPEADYNRLCRRLIRQIDALTSDYAAARADMTDYYTMWLHQIKTPIFAMQLLLADDASPKDKEISAELFKIEQYVSMALNYLRLDSDKNDLVLKSCPLDDMIRQSIRKFAPLFIRKKLSVNYTPTKANVLTDEKWLSFMIEQLLSNAVKYTSKGSVSIYMSDENTLVIEDTGIGIAPEDLPRVFEKSYTGYNGRTDKKASGLGLYLCKRTADMLSHTLCIESEPDRGTRVYIGFHAKRTLFD